MGVGLAAHAISRRRPRVTIAGWVAIALGWLTWNGAILALPLIRHGSILPDWYPPAAFLGPALLVLLFIAFCAFKLRRVKRGRTVSDKMYRYAAVWTPLYSTAWCLGLAGEYPALKNAGFALAGLSIVGLIAVTTLRELYSVVEHPVGYRR